MRFFLIAGMFQFLVFFQEAAPAGLFDAVREFGFPVVFCLILWFWFSKQNEKRHQEQVAFWADNNKYLRELVNKANHCKFEKGS